MHIFTLFTALVLSTTVSAGPHGNIPRRRHHARRVATQVAIDQKRDLSLARRDDGCTNGDWQCVGVELQRCNFDTWIAIQNCTGENVVCSASTQATGCVWSWSVDQANDTPVTVSPIPSVSVSTSPPSPFSAAPSSTQSANSSNATDLDNYQDDCDEVDDATFSSVVFSPTPTGSYGMTSVTTSTAAATASRSVIGGALYAGDTGDDGSTSSRRGRHRTSTGQDWYGASTENPAPSSTAVDDSYTSSSSDNWYASSSNDDWYDSSSTATSSSTQDWYGAGGQAYPTTTSDSWDAQSSDNADAMSSSTRYHQHSASTTASSAASTSISTSGGSTSSGSFSAPHYVIYADQWLQRMPDAGDLSSYNRFILAFWMSQSGAVDNAQAWEQFSDSYRQQVLDEYHQAGIALMVSAFGSTDAPTTDGVDPTQCAQELAAWVKQYGLDGVDIDYEDMSAMNNDYAEAWLITFQKELRSQLPAPYLISHAPVAPWFTSGNNYPSGAYVTVFKETGDGVDWWNVQFYNQGHGVYEDCESLINDSGSEWPDTSVMGINSYAGVPLDKIVIGKPIDYGAADNGYMSGATLAQCVAQAKAQGWNAGVMFWEWSALIGNSLMAEVRG